MNTPTWQEAWGCFQQVFHHKRNLDYNQYPQIGREKEEFFFWQIVHSMCQIEVPVILKKELGVDRSCGKLIRPKGRCLIKFSPRWPFIIEGAKILIKRSKRSARIINHEFAHAVDFALHGMENRRTDELIAAAAGYLFTCEHLGLYSPIQDVRYVKKWRVAPDDLKRLEKYILTVFHKMDSLFREKSTTPLFQKATR